MAVNFNIPFIPQAQITEQILQALRQGFEERMAGEQLAQRKVEEARRQATAESQIGLEQQRVGLLEKQTKQAEAGLKPIRLTTPSGEEVDVPISLAGGLIAGGFKLKVQEKAAEAKKAAEDPITKTIREAKELSDKGDAKGAADRLQLASQLAAAKGKPARPNEIELIRLANAGDPEAASTLATLQKNRVDLAKARGAAFAQSRILNYFDPNLGRLVAMSGGTAQDQIAEGKVLIPAGLVPATQLVQVQRAQSAIPAAVDAVKAHAKAWDNASDRAIFARIVKENPMGQATPDTWFSNVLNQALAANLSKEGQSAVIALRRLNETMGSLRVITGLPATIGSMATTAALLPGVQTPNSKFALEQLETVKVLVEQETGVPFFGGKGKGGQQPSGGLKILRDKDGRIIGIE